MTLIHSELTYKCLVCSHEHKPDSIEFYNVCPNCHFKASIPKNRFNEWPHVG